MSLPILDISDKLHHIIFVLLCLAYFTKQCFQSSCCWEHEHSAFPFWLSNFPLNRHTLYEHRFSVLLNVYLEEELLDNMEIWNLTFCGLTGLFSIGLYPFTFLPALDKCSSFSPSSATLVIIAVLVGVEGLLVFHKIHKHRLLLQTW